VNEKELLNVAEQLLDLRRALGMELDDIAAADAGEELFDSPDCEGGCSRAIWRSRWTRARRCRGCRSPSR
jgi:hypothetical protein